MKTTNMSNIATVVAYAITDDVENRVKGILSEILEEHHCPDLFAPVYTSVKELLINAIKANYKNIFFENYSPRSGLHKTFDYHTGLQLFQLEMNRENANYLERIARNEDIKAEIALWAADDVLHVEVINPVTMTDIELHNVKKKLSDAESCRDIAEYFIRNIDDPLREGAGLGLILIVMMLKSLGAPTESLAISSNMNRTTAYLRIPIVP
jgi:hypothetical protein